MLATPIGIDRAVEANIGGIIAGYDLSRGVDGDRCLERRQIVEGAPAVIKGHPRERLIAPRSVALGPSASPPLVVNNDAEQLADVVVAARRRGGQLPHRRALLGCV